MFKTLKNIIKTGDATIKYPFAPLKTTPHMRGKPQHFQQQCIACGACAIACPPNAIQMHPDIAAGVTKWEINYGRCIFCGRCEEVCPVSAIRLSNEFEMAVMSKADMIEDCTYTLQACAVCGKYYAPHKEVEYAKKILAQVEGNPEATEAAHLSDVCPDCKRRADALAAATRDRTKAQGYTKAPSVQVGAQPLNAGVSGEALGAGNPAQTMAGFPGMPNMQGFGTAASSEVPAQGGNK